jgi:hypothetical protein
MYEVFRDWDSAKVGLVDQLLKSEGFNTALCNWTGSNITSIPIPDMFPNVCVLTREECVRARKIVNDYFRARPRQATQDWQCPNCGETVDGVFSECWACQAPLEEEESP